MKFKEVLEIKLKEVSTDEYIFMHKYSNQVSSEEAFNNYLRMIRGY
ncbi:hypothetical protein [Metabacillus fastidiosus]